MNETTPSPMVLYVAFYTLAIAPHTLDDTGVRTMATLAELKAEFTALTNEDADANNAMEYYKNNLRKNADGIFPDGKCNFRTKETWERLVNAIKANNQPTSTPISEPTVSIDLNSFFDVVEQPTIDTTTSPDVTLIAEATNDVSTSVIQTTDKPLGEDVKIDALRDAKLVEIDVDNSSTYTPLLKVLEHYLIQFYDRENSDHNYYYDANDENNNKLVAFLVPGKKKDTVKAFMPYKDGIKAGLPVYVDDDGDVQTKKNVRINWKGVLLTALNGLPSKLKTQFLNCPIALYKYLSANCPVIPSTSYLVPSYTSVNAIRDVIDTTIATLRNRVSKLQIQMDFWTSDVSKQLELQDIKRKLRLNRRLLTVFAGKRDIAGKLVVAGLADRLAAIPDETKPDELERWFKRFNRQYLFAITANMAMVKKLPVISCLLGTVRDEKWVNLITSFNCELERVTVYDLSVINTKSTFRGIDNAEVKNGVIKAKAGFMGSVLVSQVRERVNTDVGIVRSAITGNVTLIDRKSGKEKSQTTFRKAQPQLNTDGKTLGSLLNLPPTLYRTTRNLYWLLDTTYQGLKYDESSDSYKQANSGLIAAIRVSKNADYGYFNIGELFVNAHGQIAYRLPKKSIAFMLENLAISFDEVAEGLSKLGLWRKSENSTRYFNGVINRSFQMQLSGGQLDILDDRVLYDLGVNIKRFKNESGQGCYTVKSLAYPKYNHVESFVSEDRGESVNIPRKHYTRPSTVGVLQEKHNRAKELLVNRVVELQEQHTKVVVANAHKMQNQTTKIRELERELKLLKSQMK